MRNGYAVIVGLVLIFAVMQRAPAHTYTAETISAAMAAAESQITDVKYHFNLSGPNGTPENPDSRLYCDVRFAMKQPEGYLLYDIRSASASDGIVPSRAQSDLLVAFDGTATISIDRTRDGWGRFRATIAPGFSERMFNGLENPQQAIWGMGGFHHRWWRMLAENASSFKVSQDFERIDDVDTVKLSGPLGKASTTQIALWVAPGRGFLPIQMETDYAGGRTAWRNLRSLLQLKPNIWMPQEIVERVKGTEKFGVVYDLDHIECTPLTQASFRPTIPPATHVTDQVSNLVFDTPLPTTRQVDPEATQRELQSYLRRADAVAHPAAATTEPSN
jgi:hypothetical protein